MLFMRRLWLYTLLLCTSPLWAKEAPQTLQQKFVQAQAGDYIVSLQDGNYSLLFIRAIALDTLLLEEVCIPEKQLDLKKTDWQQWLQNKAPGHTSWTLYEIDRQSGQLIECFSYSKNGWLYLDTSEQFLTQLLTLPLHPLSSDQRKKIGVPPASGEADQRALWNPPLVIAGKKLEKPAFDVLKTVWPDDGSRLALCAIELYFSKQDPAFPFPYWLEVQSPHYSFKMRTVDSGHGLVSPMSGLMPHRSPQFLGNTQKGKQSWKILVRTPRYFQNLRLFALDYTQPTKTTIPLTFTSQPGQKPEEMVLEVSWSELSKVLSVGHRYQWVLVPENGTHIYVSSEESFTWQ